MYSYEFESGANTYLFRADWGQTITWLPGSDDEFLYNTPAGDLMKYDLGTGLTVLWQDNDSLSPFGVNVYRAGPWHWDDSRTKVVFVAGVGGGGGNQLYLADMCSINASHHLCGITPLGPPTSGWATITGAGDITPDGTKVYYARRWNWVNWEVREKDLVTMQERVLLSGTDPNGQGIGGLVMLGSDQLALIYPTASATRWDIRVRRIGASLSCTTVYQAENPYHLQATRME